MAKLNSPGWHDLYAELRRSGRQDGKPLAPKTVLNVHQILRTALGDAERQSLVARNVARLAGPPCHGIAPEQQCWDHQQLAMFLAVAMGHRLGPALGLTAMTGMRRGEVIALRWTDIDLDARRLSVRRSATCTGYEVHITPTKTPTSRRTIDLDLRTVALLEQWRAVQAAELGEHRPVHVVTDGGGRMLHPLLLSQTFERLQAKARLPRIRLHDLRHTHATLLLKEALAPKVVSERLGHANVAFTMAVYQHVLPGMQRDAAILFARLVTRDDHVVPVDGR